MIIKFLPVRWQAIYWAWWAKRKYGRTSHFRIEAIRELRRTSGLYLKECKALIDEVMP